MVNVDDIFDTPQKSDSEEDHIKHRIEKLVKGQYKKWTIGTTNNPEKSKSNHEDPITWWQWKLNKEQCRKIKTHFLSKGMHEGNKRNRGQYVFIY